MSETNEEIRESPEQMAANLDGLALHLNPMQAARVRAGAAALRERAQPKESELRRLADGLGNGAYILRQDGASACAGTCTRASEILRKLDAYIEKHRSILAPDFLSALGLEKP